MKRILRNEFSASIAPTIGFDCQTIVSSEGAELSIWDFAGKEDTRPFWRTYGDDSDVVVFVVDAADGVRRAEAASLLRTALESAGPGAGLLIIANKQDVGDGAAVSAAELVTELRAEEAAGTGRPWRALGTSAATGEGVDEIASAIVSLASARLATSSASAPTAASDVNASTAPLSTSAVMIGLRGAGKTVLLYRLKLDTVISAIPTIGFNCESLDLGPDSIYVQDIGGHEHNDETRTERLTDTPCIIFVVDSSAPDQFAAAAEQLERALAIRAAPVPLLVFGNKSDAPGACPDHEVLERMRILSLVGKDRCWLYQSCSAHEGNGLRAGFDWLIKTLKEERTSV